MNIQIISAFALYFSTLFLIAFSFYKKSQKEGIFSPELEENEQDLIINKVKEFYN